MRSVFIRAQNMKQHYVRKRRITIKILPELESYEIFTIDGKHLL